MIPKSDFEAKTEIPSTVEVAAFGARVQLATAGDRVESSRRLSELKECHERFLASRVIAKSGLCVDLGAGEGWFTVPFAMAFRDWNVIAFESDSDAFALLQANVKQHGLENVICINAALHPSLKPVHVQARTSGETELPKSLMKALGQTTPAMFTSLSALAPRVAPVTDAPGNGETLSCSALPVNILAKLAPDLLKLDAPYCEEAIAQALREVPVGFLTGRLYSYVPSKLFHPHEEAGPREFYLPHHDYALRRDYEDNFPTRRPQLDVVVAMYNTREYIAECVDSILADGNPDIRVIVVDDGSTDGCGDLVEKRYAGNERVRLVRKANGGCASARNYGRRCSNASHIAFIDADDRVDEGMFTALLETARYTGAFVTEAEFSFLNVDEETGEETLTPSYEADIYGQPGDCCVGEYDFFWLPGRDIAVGQPTIWRRVHRRDFLDRKNIWFPEHVRAFDDQIFQLMVSHYCGSLAHVKGYTYHYRQHPAQDIKQGDERHFYSFNMFRSLLLRALDEHWADITPLLRSLLNTMGWSYGGLRNDLKIAYQEGAAKFLAIVSKTFGHTFLPHELNATGIDGLEFLVNRHLEKMKDEPVNYGFMRLESWRWQPELIRMMQAVRSKG
jgi:FkbM family methyltransferase